MKTELSARLATLITAFLDEEKPKVTEQGYTSIRQLVHQVGVWLDDAELDIDQVGIREALAYQYQLSTKRKVDGRVYNASTINNHLKAPRRFFDYLVKTGAAHTNPFRDLRRVKVGDHLSEDALTVEQMGKLLEALAQFDEVEPWWKRLKNYRVHVVAELLYASGMRVNEAASLEVADLDLTARTVWVRSGRNGQGRTAFLSSYATEMLKSYLEVRPALFRNYERRPYPLRNRCNAAVLGD